MPGPLNILDGLWLLIALVNLYLWRARVARAIRPPARSQRLLSLVSLVCALALLFPAISATDDLLAEQTLADESGALSPSLKNRTRHTAPIVWSDRATVSAISPRVALEISLSALERVAETQLLPDDLLLLAPLEGRAPPSLPA